MPDTTFPDANIDVATIRRINDAWPRRATIAGHLEDVQTGSISDGEYNPELADYPAALLPFNHHPEWLTASAEQRQHVLTLAWIVYNERVICAEEEVANPTFRRLARGTMFGPMHHVLQEAAQQSHVDETWHTYMHMLAVRRTRELRGYPAEPAFPPAVTYRRLLEARGEVETPHERDVLDFVWTVVSEISVNAYLELLSRNDEIQPMHAHVARLHARDESAHGSVMLEIAAATYAQMDDSSAQLFRAALPRALRAFVETDTQVWPLVLEAAGIMDGVRIMEESLASAPASRLLVRDFSGVKRLAKALNLDLDIDF